MKNRLISCNDYKFRTSIYSYSICFVDCGIVLFFFLPFIHMI